MQDQDVQNFYLISSKPSTHSNDKLQLKKKAETEYTVDIILELLLPFPPQRKE